MSDARAWIEERRAIHAKATPGEWEEDAISGLEGCVYLADGSYECVADAMSTDDAGPIVDAHNMIPRALTALEQVLELHKPEAFEDAYSMQSGFMCESCYDPDKNEWVEWPCPTVQAVQTAIEGGINE